jgi:hypothetical protein
MNPQYRTRPVTKSILSSLVAYVHYIRVRTKVAVLKQMFVTVAFSKLHFHEDGHKHIGPVKKALASIHLSLYMLLAVPGHAIR